MSAPGFLDCTEWIVLPDREDVEAVPSVWLEAIELIPASDKAIANIESAPNVRAE